MRLKTARVVGDQLPRWYTAEVPNSITAVSVKIADDTRPARVGAKTVRAMPATRAIGAAPRCSQPRSKGLSIVGSASRVSGVSPGVGASVLATNLRYRRLADAQFAVASCAEVVHGLS